MEGFRYGPTVLFHHFISTHRSCPGVAIAGRWMLVDGLKTGAKQGQKGRRNTKSRHVANQSRFDLPGDLPVFGQHWVLFRMFFLNSGSLPV